MEEKQRGDKAIKILEASSSKDYKASGVEEEKIDKA